MKALHYQKFDDITDPELRFEIVRRLFGDSADRVDFAFNDPRDYKNEPVNPSVFVKLLSHLTNPDGISEDNLTTLVGAFSRACTKDEWKNFYQPILQRKTDHGIKIGDYNWRMFSDRRDNLMVPCVPVVSNPQSLLSLPPDHNGFFYAHATHLPVLAIRIAPDSVEFLDTESMSVPRYCHLEDCFKNIQRTIDSPIWLFGQDDQNNEIYLYDAVAQDQTDAPAMVRRTILEDCYTQMADEAKSTITLGDGVYGSDANYMEVVNFYHSLGYDTLPDLLWIPEKSTLAGSSYVVPNKMPNVVDLL